MLPNYNANNSYQLSVPILTYPNDLTQDFTGTLNWVYPLNSQNNPVYELEINTSANFDGTSLSVITPILNQSYPLGNANASTKYFWRVRAVTEFGITQ